MVASMEQGLLSAENSTTRQSMFGFQVGDDVIFDGVAKVTGFSVHHGVQLELHGRGMWFHPRHLRKDSVNPKLEQVLRIFCGYIDIWLLRETFVTDFAPDKDIVKGWVEAQAKMIFEQLGMEEWTDVNPFVRFTFGLYLRKVLSPSVYFFKKHSKALSAAMGSILFLLLLVSLSGFANLRSGDTDEQAKARGAQAFSAVEHAPVTPFILALCTHVIMMIFASEQLHGLMQSDWRNLAFPLTYTIFVGKCFMFFRMVLAYSSKDLGVSIDYFIWQELILTTLHAFLALFVGDPVAPKAAAGRHGAAQTPLCVKGLSYAKQLSHACLFVFCIDLMKTLAVVIYWWTYREGAIAYYFNRLPNIQVMLATSVLVHAMLDLIQFTVTAFTMLIGRVFHTLTTNQLIPPKCQEVEEPNHEAKFISAKPAAELDDIVKMLSGSWITEPCGLTDYLPAFSSSNSCQKVEIKAEHRMMQVPEGLNDNEQFVFPTVHRLGVPEEYMTVMVPKGLSSGSPFRVVELRVYHEHSGYHSVDASRVDFRNGLCLLCKHYKRPSSAQWIHNGNGPMIKFTGRHGEAWHRPKESKASSFFSGRCRRRSKEFPTDQNCSQHRKK